MIVTVIVLCWFTIFESVFMSSQLSLKSAQQLSYLPIRQKMIHPRKTTSSVHYHTVNTHTNLHPQKTQLFKREPETTIKRMKSEKDMRLRQNYIVNRDQIYTTLQDQFNELANKPEFNRFISHKKSMYLPKNQTQIAKEIIKSHQTTDRLMLNRSGGRRKLLFQKMRRPEHNSPIKRGIKQQDMQANRHNEESQVKKLRKTLIQDGQNSMMLKQMVTRVEQSKKGKVMSNNPYSSASKDNKYYVAEVAKGYKHKESLVRDHIFNSLYFLELLYKYNNTSDYAQDKPIILPQKECYRNKITVIFDLDQTLVHCFEELSEPHQIEVPVTFPGNYKMLAPINVRPYAREVLAELAKQFQLMVFTASHQAYANAVIDYLDPKKELIQHRLFRRHCDYIEQGYYVKDLRLLGRDLSKVVLVDNAAYSYAFQVSNGIPIVPYYEGQVDYELKTLKDYLLSLRQCRDVRVVNQQTFKLSKYNGYTYVEQLVQNLYIEK